MTTRTQRTKLVNPRAWTSMAGRSKLEKQLNSYLTCQFIGSFSALPPDECLEEARYIIALVRRTP